MNIPSIYIPPEKIELIPVIESSDASKTVLQEYRYLSSTGQWIYYRSGYIYVIDEREPVCVPDKNGVIQPGKSMVQKKVYLNDMNLPKEWSRKMKRRFLAACKRCEKKGIKSGSQAYYAELAKEGIKPPKKESSKAGKQEKHKKGGNDASKENEP